MTKQLAGKTIYSSLKSAASPILHCFNTTEAEQIGSKGSLSGEARSFDEALWSHGCIIYPRLYQV